MSALSILMKKKTKLEEFVIQLQHLNLTQLKKECAKRNLKMVGKKNDLLQRIKINELQRLFRATDKFSFTFDNSYKMKPSLTFYQHEQNREWIVSDIHIGNKKYQLLAEKKNQVIIGKVDKHNKFYILNREDLHRCRCMNLMCKNPTVLDTRDEPIKKRNTIEGDEDEDDIYYELIEE